MQLTRDFSRVAATFTRLRTILKGLDPEVDTVGIMTAWNPQAKTESAEFNRKANAKLLKDLRSHGYGPIKVGGHFQFIPEGSFLIPNMDRGLLIELCGKYDQWGVVYGEKFVSRDDKVGFRFEMLGEEGQEMTPSKTMFLTSGHEKIDEASTDFSFFKGDRPKPSKVPGQPPPGPKRFKIPFFEESAG